MIRGSSCSP
uniref:Uncharacterized protein n=1 Tax=Rhizophora mucronata TaxID=61149 RepID=A0A2P2JP41_RHIMU